MTIWHAIKPDLAGKPWRPTARQIIALRTMGIKKNKPMPIFHAFNSRNTAGRNGEGFAATMKTLIRRGVVEHYTTLRGLYSSHDMPVFRLTAAGIAFAIELRLAEREIQLQLKARA